MKARRRNGMVVYDPVRIDAIPVMGVNGENLTYSYKQSKTAAEGRCGQDCRWEFLKARKESTL